MEPGHIDREDVSMDNPMIQGVRAAMEPGHIDREDRTSASPSECTPACRNGARSYRPGGPLRGPQQTTVPRGPQWSPVISTGRTRCTSPDLCRATRRNGARSYRPGGPSPPRPPLPLPSPAAMEPGHIDREDGGGAAGGGVGDDAAMEPGHIDREDGGAYGG